ncbi:MAG: peptidase C1 [candidate division KSB1 bacterium]|nr:peptidase C1 [candidate division KSB1 bacterium]MDZ7302096.1 peptidase C1 [candidate division KSB1 bacterium]MDZ7311137.1 peptidase C1 [candidate division KSB1 bacterium]
MKKNLSLLFILLTIFLQAAYAQIERRDKAIFVEPKNEFADSMRKELRMFFHKEEKQAKQLRMDLTGLYRPSSLNEFTKYWHTSPVSQGFSGMCWCFSATSFFESEIYRLTKREIKLSELYTVYWEYVEKARRFVQERGNSEFGQGSEANAVPRIWRMYGIVPAEAYTGLKPGQKFHDHDKMFDEMSGYLQSLKNTHAWNEEEALTTIKAILNHYLGEPPKTILASGKSMTPKEYFEQVVRLNLDDYVDFMSLMEKPYYQKVEYEVPDNWWHSKDYYNLPLDEFVKTIKSAIRRGYTVCIGGDVSEAGYEGHAGVAMVPTFDIPSAYIDENARQFRFSNRTTGDDHGIHLVGYLEKDGKDWYLIKDSGSGSRNNNHPGYYFYHEDYVKLKMLSFMVHRDAAGEILKKFQR